MKPLPKRPSLVLDVANLLKEEIASGRWENYLPGLRSLSEMLQVGQSTLEKAEKLLHRQKIIKIEHGQRTQIIKKNYDNTKQSKHSNIVRILAWNPVHSLKSFSITNIINIQTHLYDAGFRLQIHDNAEFREGHSLKLLEKLVSNNPAACWVLFSMDEDTQRWFMENNIPCIVNGHIYSGIKLPSIDSNYIAACRHATNKFIRANHKNIILLLDESRHAGDILAGEEFIKIINKNKDVTGRIINCGSTPDSIIKIINNQLKTTPQITGIITLKATHALTVTGALIAKKVKIPKEISILSISHEEFLSYNYPSIAGYKINRKYFSTHLSRLIIQLATDGYIPPKPLRIIPEFKKGDSFLPQHSC